MARRSRAFVSHSSPYHNPLVGPLIQSLIQMRWMGGIVALVSNQSWVLGRSFSAAVPDRMLEPAQLIARSSELTLR